MQPIPDIRLQNHQLSETNIRTPKEIVAWLGAVQAQDFNMAKWAVGLRVLESTDKSVQEAFDKGTILRTHVLRPTWHLVTPENIRWMLSLSASKILAALQARDRELGLTVEVYKKAYPVIEKALAGNQHLTREDLTTVLEAESLPTNSGFLYHLMMHAEAHGLVCSGAMRGKRQTYALLDERVPYVKPLEKDNALAKLAQIYFTSHGPASLQDFIWWSGLTIKEAKHAIGMVRTNFISEIIDSNEYLFSPQNHYSSIDNGMIHLLPAFDEYIIGYRCRKAILPMENYSKAISSNGIFRPVILQNGKAIGIWKKAASKKEIITSMFFEKAPTKKTLSLLEDAAEVYKRFLLRQKAQGEG